MAGTERQPRRSGASLQALALWALRCLFLPFALLRFTPGAPRSLVPVTVLFTALSLGVGVGYARRWRKAWGLLQACLLAGWVLGGYYCNHVLFISEAALMIYLYVLLYSREVREEFEVHAAPREVGVVLVLLGICILLTLLRPRFLEGGNFLDLVRQFSSVGVMSVGMTMVIVLGGIDLSIGSVVALSGCLAALAYCRPVLGISILYPLGIALALVAVGLALRFVLRRRSGWLVTLAGAVVLVHCFPMPRLLLAIWIALAVGGVIGALNGALISGFRMAPFIITLGTMSIARSLTNVVTNGEPIVPPPDLEPALKAIAWADTAGVPNPVWVMLLVVLLGHVFLTRTRTGRHVYYIGANEEAARLSGLNVMAVKWLVYMVCGVLAGLAGIIQAARVASGQPSAGVGDELRVIAAVIIGGASFTGGEGTVLGALVGAAIMGVLRQGLVLLDVGTYWQKFVEGAVIIGAVALDMLRRRIRR